VAAVLALFASATLAQGGKGGTGATPPAAANDADAGPSKTGEENAGGDDEVVDLSAEPDLVNTLDGGAAPPPMTPTRTETTPTKPDKFEFRGFARLTAGVGVASIAPDPPGSAPQERVPYDRAFAEQHLYVDMRYSREKWFQAVASASLMFAGFYQVNRPSSGAPDTSLDPQAFEATPREAYVAFTFGPLDLRIGQQRIVWGNSDFFTPNDVLNGRDLRNPLVLDSEMFVLPSPAVRADLDMNVAILSFIAEPFNVSDRFDLYGTNWALVQEDAPKSYRRLFGTLSQGQSRVSVSALQDALTGGQLAPANASNGSLGGSLRMKAGSVDLSYYFLSGFDRTPAVYIDPAFQHQLESLDANALNGAVFEAVQNQARASNQTVGGPILIAFRRRNHVGMDAQTALGPFVLRADVAYDSAKVFFSSDTMNSVIRPAVQEVVGIEYQTGSLKKLIGVEGWAMQVLNPEVLYVPSLAATPPSQLLWYTGQNFAVAGVVRWSFFEHTIFETRSQVGITPFSLLSRTEFGWESSAATIRAGFLGIGGTDNSLGHYFRRNNTGYLTTRISF
jgi:hypothetical protein